MKNLGYMFVLLSTLLLTACNNDYEELILPEPEVRIQTTRGELISKKSTITLNTHNGVSAFHFETVGNYAGEFKEVYLEFGFGSDGMVINNGYTFSTDEIGDYQVHAQYFYNEKSTSRWIELPAMALNVTLSKVEKIAGNYYGSGSFELNYTENVSIDFYGQFKNVKMFGIP